MDVFVIDTHALAWFFAEDSRLSPIVDSILVRAEATTAQILMPTLVLAELTLFLRSREFRSRSQSSLRQFKKLAALSASI